jgi:hypothetical protein
MPSKHLRLKPYADQKAAWPEHPRVILAQFDDESVVVYQAYPPGIARYAAEHQQLGGPDFSFERMTWIKTRFLWMMHRSAWASSPGQERVLAIWMDRAAFDGVLAAAVPSHFDPKLYRAEQAWRQALDASEVLVQWDPDYSLRGIKEVRRKAIQLGLRGETLRRFAAEWIMAIEDITPLVHQMAEVRRDEALLLLPAESIYPVRDPAVARRLALDKSAPG